MAGDTPDISGMVSDPEFSKLAPGDQREALHRLTGDESFTKLSDSDIGQFITKVTPKSPENKGFLTTAPTDQAHPIMSALAQEGLGDLNEAEAKAKFGQDHPWINAIGDTLSVFPSMIPSLGESLAKQGFPSVLRASLGSMAKRAAIGGGTGAALGGIFGGKTGAKIGAVTGAITGGASGYGEVPATVEQEAERIVERQLAVKAARVKAGVDPPAEDSIAELLRQEFLEPPKKSGVPQEISSPRAKTPTYVPQGVPGAPEMEPPPKTIGQIAKERVATATRKAGDKALQKTADIEAGVGKIPPPPEAPVSQLSEGPTALQHQIARQNALEDIRNSTINRPGWTSKLPDRATFKKLTPIQQRTLVQRAITSDPKAIASIRSSARIGSAGDLASWTEERLMTRYMQEYKSPTPDKGLMDSLRKELERKGAVKASGSSVRP